MICFYYNYLRQVRQRDTSGTKWHQVAPSDTRDTNWVYKELNFLLIYQIIIRLERSYLR